MTEIIMTSTQFKRFKNNLKNGIANDIVNELVKSAPVDTGLLRGSIHYQQSGEDIIIGMVDYAKYVEFGTPPHIITPKNAKALHWTKAGTGPRGGKTKDDVFAKVVHHPGTRPQPFIRNTLRNKLGNIIIENIERHAK